MKPQAPAIHIPMEGLQRAENPTQEYKRTGRPVVTSWNSQGTVPSRDGVQQAYLRLGTMRETQHKRITRRTCTALHLSGLTVQSRLDRGPCGLTDLAGLCGKEGGMMKSLKANRFAPF